MAGTKGHSGGPRPNSGRPRKVKTASEKTKHAIMKAARKLARENGMPIEEAMLSMIYDPKVQDSTKASIWKSYLGSLVAKEIEKKVGVAEETRPQGPLILSEEGFGAIKHLPPEIRAKLPAVILPELSPDPALKIALNSPAFYVGALGSRKTHQKRIERLQNDGLSKSKLDQIHAPVGLDLGGKTPPEIALGIMAEILQIWYGREKKDG